MSDFLALRKVAPAPGAELARLPVPEPDPREALVRVRAASIGGTDRHV